MKLLLLLLLVLQAYYGHYKRQPSLAGTPVKNWRIFCWSKVLLHARMPLLTANSAFGTEIEV